MLLDIKNLTVKYGEIKALDDISLTVKEHELTTLLGAKENTMAPGRARC